MKAITLTQVAELLASEPEGVCWEREDGRHVWADGGDWCLYCGVDYEHRAVGDQFLLSEESD